MEQMFAVVDVAMHAKGGGWNSEISVRRKRPGILVTMLAAIPEAT